MEKLKVTFVPCRARAGDTGRKGVEIRSPVTLKVTIHVTNTTRYQPAKPHSIKSGTDVMGL